MTDATPQAGQITDEVQGILLPPGSVDDPAYLEGWLDGQTYLLLNQRASPAPSGQEKDETWHMAQHDAAHADADVIGVGYTVDGEHVDPRRVSVFRPMSYLETLAAPSGQGVSGGRKVHDPALETSIYGECPQHGRYARIAPCCPAPSCAPEEVERLREAAWRWRTGAALTVKGLGIEPADLERAADALAALSPQGLDAKVGGPGRTVHHTEDCEHPHCPIQICKCPSTPSQRLDAATVEREEAMRDLLDCADQMPKQTPAPGHSATEHQFTIEAGVIWSLDRAVQRLRRALATEPHQHGGKGE